MSKHADAIAIATALQELVERIERENRLYGGDNAYAIVKEAAAEAEARRAAITRAEGGN